MNRDILEEKLDLIRWLSTIEDEAIIKDLIEFRKKKRSDWWDDLASDEKSSISKGIEEADRENLEPHSKARKIYDKWL